MTKEKKKKKKDLPQNTEKNGNKAYFKIWAVYQKRVKEDTEGLNNISSYCNSRRGTEC